MKGYKVFNSKWCCLGFQYEVGRTFEMEEEPVLCRRGFHFFRNLMDCFSCCRFSPENKLAEVEASGTIITDDEGEAVTNKITIVKELSWEEALRLVNIGKNNIGYGNTGDENKGSLNTGCRNTGDHNVGMANSGNCNAGDCNAGYLNTGGHNIGRRNAGSNNTGQKNTGNYNDGDWNTGNNNVGMANSGNCNIGSHNTGSHNKGFQNSGDWNVTISSSGCFCTEEPKILMFNKPSPLTLREWRDSSAYIVLSQMPKAGAEWVYHGQMSEEEKAEHPEYKTTYGYLKTEDGTEAAQKWWKKLSREKQEIVKGMPNFDAEIFRRCTGINVADDGKRKRKKSKNADHEQA